MDKKTLKIIKLMWQIIQNKKRFLFWFTVRFFSVFLPLLTIYLFSKVINLVELKADFSSIFFLILVTLAIKIIDNFTRLRSVTKLDECISDIGFDIHNYFIKDLKSETKLERNESIQAIRNFSDATALTLELLRQPGIDSIISLITIPFIMLSVDARISILEVVYIIVYFVIDYYTTQRYVILKDFQNTKVESYYAKFQETNDIDLEQRTFSRHYTRLSNWFFTEWFTLQNTAVFFYILIFVYLIISVYTGTKLISDLILIMTYVASTQTYLNSSSEVKDSLADVDVAVSHLAKNKAISVIDFDDLV
jgi:ABC-type multidrug transport system fused ATPase/permease subunit